MQCESSEERERETVYSFRWCVIAPLCRKNSHAVFFINYIKRTCYTLRSTHVSSNHSEGFHSLPFTFTPPKTTRIPFSESQPLITFPRAPSLSAGSCCASTSNLPHFLSSGDVSELNRGTFTDVIFPHIVFRIDTLFVQDFTSKHIHHIAWGWWGKYMAVTNLSQQRHGLIEQWEVHQQNESTRWFLGVSTIIHFTKQPKLKDQKSFNGVPSLNPPSNSISFLYNAIEW